MMIVISWYSVFLLKSVDCLSDSHQSGQEAFEKVKVKHISPITFGVGRVKMGLYEDAIYSIDHPSTGDGLNHFRTPPRYS